MLIDLNGPDFLRVQRVATSRIADPLDPDVLISGAFDDGQVLSFQQAVNAAGIATVNYTVNLGQTFSQPPLVYGGLKLTQAVMQRNTADTATVTYFSAGEIVSPCGFQYTKSGKGRIVNYGFTYIVSRNTIELTISGFVGTAMFLVVDV